MPIERTAVQVPVEGVKGISARIFGIEAMLRCIAAALESGDESATRDVSSGVAYIADEVSRLACDLDVATWPKEAQS